MPNNTPTPKRPDEHKRIALRAQEQADDLLTNLFKLELLAEQTDNKQLLATARRAIEAARICFSEVLAIRTIITRDY